MRNCTGWKVVFKRIVTLTNRSIAFTFFSWESSFKHSSFFCSKAISSDFNLESFFNPEDAKDEACSFRSSSAAYQQKKHICKCIKVSTELDISAPAPKFFCHLTHPFWFPSGSRQRQRVAGATWMSMELHSLPPIPCVWTNNYTVPDSYQTRVPLHPYKTGC